MTTDEAMDRIYAEEWAEARAHFARATGAWVSPDHEYAFADSGHLAIGPGDSFEAFVYPRSVTFTRIRDLTLDQAIRVAAIINEENPS